MVKGIIKILNGTRRYLKRVKLHDSEEMLGDQMFLHPVLKQMQNLEKLKK